MVTRAGISLDLGNIYVDDDIPSTSTDPGQYTTDPPSDQPTYDPQFMDAYPSFMDVDPTVVGGPSTFAQSLMDEFFSSYPPPSIPPTQETDTSQAGPSTSQAGPSTSQIAPPTRQFEREGRGTRRARFTPSPLIPRSRREPPPES